MTVLCGGGAVGLAAPTVSQSPGSGCDTVTQSLGSLAVVGACWSAISSSSKSCRHQAICGSCQSICSVELWERSSLQACCSRCRQRAWVVQQPRGSSSCYETPQ